MTSVLSFFLLCTRKHKNGKTKIDFRFIFIRFNACTLVPTVFRWHKKMEFKFHFYFLFFFGLVKWNSISFSIFRFLSTCDIEKRIWISFFVFAALWKEDLNFGFCFSFSHHFEKRIGISFFVFRFRITLENGFEFRFSYLHCLLLKNRLEFRLSFLHEFEKWINTPVIWNSASPPPKGMSGVMRGLSLHNHPIFIPQ